jgi:hypothetical protein
MVIFSPATHLEYAAVAANHFGAGTIPKREALSALARVHQFWREETD